MLATKFHYTSWFRASSELAPNPFRTGSELAPNQLVLWNLARTSFKPAPNKLRTS